MKYLATPSDDGKTIYMSSLDDSATVHLGAGAAMYDSIEELMAAHDDQHVVDTEVDDFLESHLGVYEDDLEDD